MFRNIGSKLMAAVSIAAIIIISAFAYLNIHSQSGVLLSEIERHANQLSETIKGSTRSAMLANNRESTHEIIRTIGGQPCMRNVRVMNKEGYVIYSADTTEIGIMVDKNAEACYTCHANDKPLEKLEISERTRIFRLHPDSARILGTISPIYNEPSCWNADCHAHPKSQTVLGVLDVAICLREVDEKLTQAKYRMLIFAIISILALCLVLAYFVRIWIDRPVKGLVDATKQVASGNLSHRVEHTGHDELGMLARSFNNMTRKLSEARQQLFQSDKMASLGRLAAGVAHEINNPLTGILTYSSFLLKRTKGQQELQNDLAVIVRETKRSREIVKGLLDFARQSVPKKNKVNLNDIINRSLEVIDNQLSIKRIKVKQQLSGDIPMVTVDANQMQQVFTNLLVNASHAIGKDGGLISVSSKSIALGPYGVSHIKQALCPKGHDLGDPDTKIDGIPSIKINARFDGIKGPINLDPIYGKNRHIYGVSMPDGAPVSLNCPKCDISLIDKNMTCPRCRSVVYFLEIPGKGRFQGCISENCPWQYWESIENEGKKQYIEIEFSDDGCGIPQESLPRIFEPFYTTKGQKGTGLGLAVIWGIVDNHNGTISVSSDINKGTTFTLRLPAAK